MRDLPATLMRLRRGCGPTSSSGSICLTRVVTPMSDFFARDAAPSTGNDAPDLTPRSLVRGAAELAWRPGARRRLYRGLPSAG
jgi:hypothetical protein